MNMNCRTLVQSAFLLVSLPVHAEGFIADSSAKLLARNYYFDRDYHTGAGQSRAQEWAQGFILKLNSGYTAGTVGFGLDLTTMTGIALDSSPDRTGTGLIPYGPTSRETSRTFTKGGVTAKMKFSHTEVRAGQVAPVMPILFPGMTRLFPPTFNGLDVISNELDNVTVHLGNINRTSFRDSTNWEPLRVASQNNRFIADAQSKSFSYGGADWTLRPNLVATYYYAKLENIYQQHYLGLVNISELGAGKLKTDLRYHYSEEDGSAKGGPVDNRTYEYNLTYSQAGHSFSFGQQWLTGSTAMPYLTGTVVYVISEGAIVSEFANPQELVRQARYVYDFAGVGVPGLTLLARYVDGSHIKVGARKDADETERSWELGYVVQSGSMKNLGLRLRGAHYTSNYFRDADELRVNIDYPLDIF